MSDEAPAEKQLFDRHMLEALVCPLTHAVLKYDAEKQELISQP
ncbi:MAG: Trm112 family protein, partial [Thioclava sp.]|nr:Trm112 family protein [Thioclava sp.]